MKEVLVCLYRVPSAIVLKTHNKYTSLISKCLSVGINCESLKVLMGRPCRGVLVSQKYSISNLFITNMYVTYLSARNKYSFIVKYPFSHFIEYLQSRNTIASIVSTKVAWLWRSCRTVDNIPISDRKLSDSKISLGSSLLQWGSCPLTNCFIVFFLSYVTGFEKNSAFTHTILNLRFHQKWIAGSYSTACLAPKSQVWLLWQLFLDPV